MAAALVCAAPLEASTIYVPAGGNLQRALDDAQPGDTILLAEGAEFAGNFLLPVKSGSEVITVRSAAPDAVLPPAGHRVQPFHAPLLARLRSPNAAPALRTAPGAHHWTLSYLEFPANQNGYGDVIQIGDGSNAQDTLAEVPHHITLTHLFIHGDPRLGQKRGIALNAAHVTIADSHISECKAVGQDAQAIAGWNGPGPYHIENNYLEGAGENLLFGGADPAIPNLVVDGVTVRRNLFSRPLSWRDPIIPTPGSVMAKAGAAGSLAAGVYAYRIVARGPVGQNAVGRSTASAEVKVTVTTDGSAVTLTWNPVPGATEYRVYGRLAGAQTIAWRVTAPQFVDMGQSGTVEAVPTAAGTVWSVKNLFELKNARNVVVEGNIFENHWKESQAGYAIVLTPRNSNGACTWCVIENFRFEYNIVRNVAAGINLLGYDIPTRPTLQTKNTIVRHNLFQDVTTRLGGNGWFMLIGDEPRGVIVEHNTITADGNALVYTYGGTSASPRLIYGLRMSANAARHGSYGMNGSFFSYGNGILNGYYPDYEFSANYLAGGASSRYPAGNLFAGAFPDQFVSAATGDFTVREDSLLKGAAADGTDIGVDMAELSRRTQGVESGVPTSPPAADFTFACRDLTCAFSCTSAAAGGAIVARSWDFGDGQPQPTQPAATVSEVLHLYGTAGTFPVTLQVVDTNGLVGTVTKLVTVETANVAPAAGFTATCTGLTCAFTDQSVDTDGRIARLSWTFEDGAASTDSAPAHTFSAPGTYLVQLTATDDDGASAHASREVSVRSLVHGAIEGGTTTRWNAKSGAGHYWSADVTVSAHDEGERPLAGATITAAWTGALTQAVSCVTAANGQCTFSSGTLSMNRRTVTLTVSAVRAPLADYAPLTNHGAAGTPGSSITLVKP